jgi:hypothetical protein
VLNRSQRPMRRCDKAPRCLYKYRVKTAAVPLWMQLHRITITLTLALFYSCILSAQSNAYASIWIDKAIETSSTETTTPDDPHALYSSRDSSTRTGAAIDHPTCKTAEQLYEAASADARTLERAIFISEFRQEVERALGKSLSDNELRTLADKAREEAHRWYKYIQTDSRCAAKWHGELIPWLNRHTSPA